MENNEKGGVALEYVLVTSFAAVATTIILGVMTLVAKKKVGELASKYKVEADFGEFELFKD